MSMLEYMQSIVDRREAMVTSSSTTTITETYGRWAFMATIEGPGDWEIDDWLHETYDGIHDYEIIAAHSSGRPVTNIYFDDSDLGLHIKLTWSR